MAGRPAARSARPATTADLWILAGQSNMEGVAPFSGDFPTHPRLWACDMDERWTLATPPMHHIFCSKNTAHRQVFLASGFSPDLLDRLAARGRASTVRRAGPGYFFGQFLLKHLGRQQEVALLPCAHGGTTIGQWSPDLPGEPGSTLYSSMILRARGTGLKPRGVLWYQGESDAQPGLSRAYERNLLQFIDRLRDDLGDESLPIFIVQLGRIAGTADGLFRTADWDRIREAHRTITQRRRGVYLTSAIDGTLSDMIHADLATQQLLGERLARLALTHVYKKAGEWGDTIQPAEVTTDIMPWRHPLLEFDYPIIKLRFSGVQGELRVHGGAGAVPSGFSVAGTPRVRHQPLEIWRTELNPDGPGTVRLYLNVVAGTRRIGVAYGLGRNPHCNVIDAAGMALPAFASMWVPYPVARRR